uniref:PH domain-containing protein n=1 Tax=Arcella intermedia TaxID=1963864 RepID=A0A6B2L8X7_9EUKA
MDAEQLKLKSKEQLEVILKDLEAIYQKKLSVQKGLEKEIQKTLSFQAEKHKEVEAEEEFITIKLIKRLEELKNEKTDLVARVEREEEYLTNTLQKKLKRLEQEKVDLEQKLEIEEEYIINKLQKQFETLQSEKLQLEQQLEGESIAGLETRKLRLEMEDYKRKKDRQTAILKSENSELQLVLQKEKEKFQLLNQEKAEWERQSELEDEHHINTKLNCPQFAPRKRGISTNRSVLKSSTGSLSPRGQQRTLKRGWLEVLGGPDKKNQEESEGELFFTLTEESLTGYESESIEMLPPDSISTKINLGKVEDVVLNGNGFTLKLKSGEMFTFVGNDASSWCNLIKDLLP